MDIKHITVFLIICIIILLQIRLYLLVKLFRLNKDKKFFGLFHLFPLNSEAWEAMFLLWFPIIKIYPSIQLEKLRKNSNIIWGILVISFIILLLFDKLQ